MKLLAFSVCLPLLTFASSGTPTTTAPSTTVTLTPAEQSSAAALAAQIPKCAQSCDQKAIAAAGCQPTEFECHCEHSAELQASVASCLSQNGNPCTQADLQKLGGLAQQICQAIGFVAPSGTSSSASVTGTGTTPAPTITSTGGTASGASASGAGSKSTGAAAHGVNFEVSSVWSGVIALILSTLY